MISSDLNAWQWLDQLKDSQVLIRMYTTEFGDRKIYLKVELLEENVEIKVIGSSLASTVNEIISHLEAEDIIGEVGEEVVQKRKFKRVYSFNIEDGGFSGHT